MYAAQTEHQVIDANVSVSSNLTKAELQFGTGSLVQGPGGQIMAIPNSLHTFPFDKSNLRQLINAMQDALEKMKDESNIVTASSMAGIDQIAELDGRLRT